MSENNVMADNIPFDTYVSMQGINASAIKQGVKSMSHMKAYVDGKMQRESPAFTTGRKSHSCVLEPEIFFPKLRTFDGDKRKKEWKEFKAVNDPDFIVTPSELSQLMAMRDAMHSDRDIKDLIDCTDHEVTLQWGHKLYKTGKARLDGYSRKRNLVVEYKTAVNISEWAFRMQVSKLGYDLGAGWYSHGVEVIHGTLPDFVYIVQEKTAPFDCFAMDVPREIIKEDAEKAIDIAKRFNAARVTGTYMGVANGQRLQFERPWEKDETFTVGEKQ